MSLLKFEKFFLKVSLRNSFLGLVGFFSPQLLEKGSQLFFTLTLKNGREIMN
jgi:hypothetical protein